ncbi:hypothetical protein COLO4_13866 [Corchorus olitorius]|uniref:Uncharacterized protein n=1 Tax=Corchorus olitorius TaxID=93759 RepID=A0A1R3JUT8_9ROSI|nr:hypothetical protein COLO4_13866 [Corchorus olitorius]
MAGAVSLSPTFSFVPKLSLKPLVFSALSTPVPSKLAKRKNYLRPKILKTFTKPFPSPTPTNPIAPVESPPETKPADVFVFEPPSSEELPSKIEVTEETSKVEEFQVLETSGVAGENDVTFGKISAYSVLKYGFYFVGFFVFQTVVAVWVMSNGNPQDKGGNLDDVQRNKSKNGKFFNDGKVKSGSTNVLYRDNSEMEQKIEEIKAMAREVRKTEEKEMENGYEGDDDMLDENLNSKAKIGIEKEIGARLNNLEKRLNSKRENLPGSYMNLLDKLNDAEEAKEMNEKLFVKKKFQFRGPEKNSRSGVKGFPGSKDGSASRNNNGVASSRTKKVDNEGSRERLSSKVMKSRDTQNSQILPKENQEARTKSDKHTSKRREVSNKLPAKRVKDKQSSFNTDPWWLNLPYVLAILMRRGIDRDGPGGLFTLRISEGEEQSETPCTVAFEDQSDANNFCYLLECFFEDLGDFSAEVVAMSAKELYEAMKSHAKKVLVVKKGQLKLYAGQPFGEVEKALQSLIEDNQGAIITNSE